MCNLCSLTEGKAAFREIAGAMTDRTGNPPALPAIFPDQAPPFCVRAATAASW